MAMVRRSVTLVALTACPGEYAELDDDGDGDGDGEGPGDGEGEGPGDGDGEEPGDGEGDASAIRRTRLFNLSPTSANFPLASMEIPRGQ